jgi:Acetyltransferase (GNAT) domain
VATLHECVDGLSGLGVRVGVHCNCLGKFGSRVIYTLDPLLDSRWDEFLQRAPRASAFHSSGWLRALAQSYGYLPVVFTTTPPGSPLQNGTVFAAVKNWFSERRLVSLPFSDHVDPLMDAEEALSELLATLKTEQCEGRWLKIELRPTETTHSQTDWPLFHDGFSYILQKVDLRPGLDAVFSRFHRDSIRRKIRKAERCGVVQEVGRDDRLLQQFFHLAILTRRRHSLPPPPLAWFRNILVCFGENAKIRVASKDGKPVAAILTLRFKQTALYKYGCSDSNFHNLGTMPFLLWKAMEEEYQTGAKEFDLGRSDLDNHGLIRFKEKLGAEPSLIRYKVFPKGRPPEPGHNWRLNFAKKIFRLLPEKALVFAGSQIYPHIG